MIIEQILFYVFSAILIFSALMVISSRNSVHSALYLVLAFFATAALWILLEAEFLALVLVLVYVGAVMTLFLFVVMMLNLDTAPRKSGFVKYAPVGIIIAALIVAAVIYVLRPDHYIFSHITQPVPKAASFSNVAQLGSVLYTQYVYPFEIAAALLLVAIIAAVTLSLRRARGKTQNISEQLRVKAEQRIRLVNEPAAKKSQS